MIHSAFDARDLLDKKIGKKKSMKIHVAGREVEPILRVLAKRDVEIVENSPDLVVTHGGDGALLGAERDFPGVPKLPFRDLTCEEHSSFEKIFDLYVNDQLKKTELIKIAGFANGKILTGINDVFIHNVDRGGALRYRVLIDDVFLGHEIIGDGVGVSTVHGSTAYYRSITHSIFKVGIGLAFNNSTEVTNHQVLPEDTEVKIIITRGPAILIADNCPEAVSLKEGDEVIMRKVSDKAVIYGLGQFMCEKCRRLRHSANRKK